MAKNTSTQSDQPEAGAGLGIHPTGVRAAEDVEQTSSPGYPANPDPVPDNDENFTPQQPQVTTEPEGIPSNALPPTVEETYGEDGQSEDVKVLDGTDGMVGAPEDDEDEDSTEAGSRSAKTRRGR